MKLFEFTVTHEQLQVSKGLYSISLVVRGKVTKTPILRINSLSFQVLHNRRNLGALLLKSKFKKPNRLSKSRFAIQIQQTKRN
jgi:lipopolysaccharide transport system ATP-binding protein